MRCFINRNGMRFHASRMLLKLRARAYRSMLEVAAAVRTHVAQRAERAHLAERAFIRANHCVGRVGRQRLAASFARRSDFEHGVFSGIGRKVRGAPRLQASVWGCGQLILTASRQFLPTSMKSVPAQKRQFSDDRRAPFALRSARPITRASARGRRPTRWSATPTRPSRSASIAARNIRGPSRNRHRSRGRRTPNLRR